MPVKTYSLYLKDMSNTDVIFMNCHNSFEAIAEAQKALNFRKPKINCRWECVRATVTEEQSNANNKPTVHATLFEIDELEIYYQREEKRIKRIVPLHRYHYVLASNTAEAIAKTRRSLQLLKVSRFHELVYQTCTHYPFSLTHLPITPERQHEFQVAT